MFKHPKKIFQNRPQNGPKFFQNRGLEGVLERFGHPLGAKMAQGRQKLEKWRILGSPGGSKMEPKLVKNLMKNRVHFCNDFETTFSRSWDDFGSKNLSKMRSRRVVFSTSLRICEKYENEQPSIVLARFFDFGSLDFRVKTVYFSNVFPNSVLRRTFFDFWSIFAPTWQPNGSQNGYQNLCKIMLNFSWFFLGLGSPPPDFQSKGRRQ